MDMSLTPEDEAFRQEVREFIADNLDSAPLQERLYSFYTEETIVKDWQSKLFKKGWIAPGWPVEYGGAGWTETQKHIFHEETALVDAPHLSAFGLSMVGPVIYTFGNDEQKAQHLPKILSGEMNWCQGYSEPGSGSDLASLKTAAVRDGEDYIVNGQKIWTSNAHFADWIFCLVRTNPDVKKQQGISFLLIDMKSPGIDVKPILTIDNDHHLNEVFFSDVRVPAANRVGEENIGWTYAKFLLANERTGIAGVGSTKHWTNRLKVIAGMEPFGDGRKLGDDPAFQTKLADVEIKLSALEYTNLRTLAEVAAGRDPGPGSSMLKILGTEVAQAMQHLTMEAASYFGMPLIKHVPRSLSNIDQPIGPGYWSDAYSSMAIGRASSIYGGTNEVQRNVIAKAVLGL